MSKFEKFKEIIAIAGPIAKPFVPGAAGSVLDAVTKALPAHGMPPAPGTEAAIKKLAADNDEQTAAILALHERLKQVETKLNHIGVP